MFLILVAVLFSVSAFSQAPKVKYHTNWFISIGAGAQMTVNENFPDHWDNRYTPMVTASVGKWFSPIWGLRGTIDGWSAKSPAGPGSTPYYDADKGYANFNYLGAHVDVMFNILNANCYYSRRTYEPILYAGVGLARSFMKEDSPFKGTHDNTISGHLGLLNRFRLSRKLDFNVDFKLAAYDDDFNGIDGGFPIDLQAGAVVGLTYKF